MTEFTNSFSEQVWNQKYNFNDGHIDNTHLRVAKDLAKIENDSDYWTEQFLWAMEDFKFVPGGRITSNAGTGLSGTTYINCFVDGFMGPDQDSIEGIYETLLRQALILKSEGGYGFCCDVMRPRGTTIKGIGNQTPGAVKFLELWDKSSEIITAGSGKKSKAGEKIFIRKGAQMVTMSCWHPDIIEFIEAKKVEGQLSKFNMSVLCTDKFMESVKHDLPWILHFPDTTIKQYKTEWNGNIEAWIDKGYPVVVHHEFKSARELWKLIMDNTYNRNEPGVLFVDTINKFNNLHYCEYINATNPCGEQCLPIGAVCLLGSLNLVHFIDVKTRDWKYKELEKIIPIVVRMMDNVNDITHVPLAHQKENLQDKRRIGLGVVGYASALMMARIKYGSPKAIEMSKKLIDFINETAYQSSALLAKEKNPFKLFKKDDYLASNYIKKLSRKTRNLIAKHGIRNSHLLSIQPTGNSSVFANLVSSGIEPIFALGYYRTAIQPETPEGLDIPRVDWTKKTLESGSEWKWIKEGDEDILIIKHNDTVYKFDRNRGLTKEEWIEDYAITDLKRRGVWDENKNWAAHAMNLDVDSHIRTMTVFAQGVDSAISKTINLPNDYPYADFKDVYIKAWNNDIKGFTTYREGTMTHVLSTKSSFDKSADDVIIKTNAPKRPKELECDVHHITVKGKPYFVLVGLINDQPYEVFAGKNGHMDKSVKKGTLIKFKRPKYYKAILEDGVEISPVTMACDENEEALTRLTSLGLRHGSDIQYVVEQLEKVHGDMTCFAKSVARALKKYIPDGTKVSKECEECNKGTLIRQEGCVLCTSCGWSKCL